MPTTAVNVLNSNDFPLEDAYDGVFYTFAPGKAVTIPVEAAKHIFGWDERAPHSISFPHVEQRWGWNTKETRPHAKEWFKNFIVRPVETITVEIVSMPSPEHRPTSSSPERKRELARQRVARHRARKKVRCASVEGVM